MYWLAIVLLGTIIGIIFIAVVRKRLDIIAMPFLLSVIMAYLYIFLPVRGILSGNLWLYVTPEEAAWAIIFPAMALVAFYFGWFALERKGSLLNRQNDLQKTAAYSSPDRLYRSGILLAIIGMGLWGYFLIFSGGVMAFYSRSVAGRWEDTTAWLYSGIQLNYPAIAFMIIALVRAGVQSKRQWATVIILIVAMYLHAILIAGRGPFFQLTTTVATVFMLAGRKRPRLSTTIYGMAIGIAGILLLVGYREALFIGTSAEKFRETRFVDITTTGEGDATGNEFVFHAGVLTTVNHLQQYGWGERYLRYLVLHPIPRLLWPSKHKWLQDTCTITGDDIERTMGWTVAQGSALGLVADWYQEWGICSILAWCILGALLGLLYKKATEQSANPMAMTAYALVMGRMLHLVAQEFLTLVETILFMMAGAYIACWLCARWTGLHSIYRIRVSQVIHKSCK